MISVVIPTLNAAAALPASLTALVPAAMSNLVREVVIADAGSDDETLEIAYDAGARVIEGREGLVALGCAAAKGPWLMILQPRTRLGPEWEAAARDHIEHHSRDAGYFRFALDDHRVGARMREAAVSARCSLLGTPLAGQGLLLSARLLDAVGGVPAGVADPEQALARRLRSRLRPLSARAFV